MPKSMRTWGELTEPWRAVRLALALRLFLVAAGFAVGLWKAGDSTYYFAVGARSELGQYPYLHFWMEYPPALPLLAVALYRVLASLELAAEATFAASFAGLMCAIDLVNLVLLHRLVRRVHGLRPAAAAALVYAGLPPVVWFGFGWFEPMAVLMLLAALAALLDRRLTAAGVLIGAGVLVKLFPGVLLLVVPAVAGWRGTRQVLLAALAVITLVLLPLALLRDDLLIASFASMATRQPWESLPALVAGDYRFGKVLPLDARGSAMTAFDVGGPSLGPVPLLAQAVLAIATLAVALGRTSVGRASPRRVCLMLALALSVLLLTSKGFSAQFVVWLIPVILLGWPNRVGIFYCLLLSLHTAGYYTVVLPTLTAYYREGHGSLEQVAIVSWLSVGARTLVLGVLAGHLLTHLSARTEVSSGSGRLTLSVHPAP
jgi:hypothetical protein